MLPLDVLSRLRNTSRNCTARIAVLSVITCGGKWVEPLPTPPAPCRSPKRGDAIATPRKLAYRCIHGCKYIAMLLSLHPDRWLAEIIRVVCRYSDAA
jgi:hypothetical protein